jgi:hypothetical protein
MRSREPRPGKPSTVPATHRFASQAHQRPLGSEQAQSDLHPRRRRQVSRSPLPTPTRVLQLRNEFKPEISRMIDLLIFVRVTSLALVLKIDQCGSRP